MTKSWEEQVKSAIRIARLWRAGKMIGGDEDEVRDTLLAEVERLRAEPNALPPPAEWYLVGEVRRAWPDDQRLVRYEDYQALREHIELERAAPCPQCIHGDGTHEATCPLKPGLEAL